MPVQLDTIPRKTGDCEFIYLFICRTNITTERYIKPNNKKDMSNVARKLNRREGFRGFLTTLTGHHHNLSPVQTRWGPGKGPVPVA